MHLQCKRPRSPPWDSRLHGVWLRGAQPEILSVHRVGRMVFVVLVQSLFVVHCVGGMVFVVESVAP